MGCAHQNELRSYYGLLQAKKWLVASEKEDSVASLRGKEVLIPSNALAALVERHGSGVFLHGIVQVRVLCALRVAASHSRG